MLWIVSIDLVYSIAAVCINHRSIFVADVALGYNHTDLVSFKSFGPQDYVVQTVYGV